MIKNWLNIQNTESIVAALAMADITATEATFSVPDQHSLYQKTWTVRGPLICNLFVCRDSACSRETNELLLLLL